LNQGTCGLLAPPLSAQPNLREGSCEGVHDFALCR
jgi:hypothetical protein